METGFGEWEKFDQTYTLCNGKVVEREEEKKLVEVKEKMKTKLVRILWDSNNEIYNILQNGPEPLCLVEL